MCVCISMYVSMLVWTTIHLSSPCYVNAVYLVNVIHVTFGQGWLYYWCKCTTLNIYKFCLFIEEIFCSSSWAHAILFAFIFKLICSISEYLCFFFCESSVDFPPKYQDWATTDPISLFEAPAVKSESNPKVLLYYSYRLSQFVSAMQHYFIFAFG